MPVFALGRTQELLLILDEHWRAHPDLHDVPIFFASKLAAKALRIYQTYINMMNDRIRKQIAISNPFQFQHISNLKSLADFDDSGPCVVLASPGMLQSGVSRELFERWCVEKRNACLIPGYVVEGTLAKKILSEPSEITAMDGRLLPLNCSVDYISFSAHADFVGTSGFVEKLQPPNIVLVHGEKTEMGRLRNALLKKFKDRQYQPTIHMPANMEEIVFEFKGEKMAKAIGTLAAQPPEDGKRIMGLLVEHDFHTHIMSAEDLIDYTQLVPSTVAQKQHIPFHQPFEVFVQFVEQLFDEVEQLVPKAVGDEDVPEEEEETMATAPQADNEAETQPQIATLAANEVGIRICQCVTVTHQPPDRLQMDWVASPVADMIADSIVALAMQAQASAASFKKGRHPTAACKHEHNKDKDVEDTLQALGEENEDNMCAVVIYRLMKEQFGNVLLKEDTKEIQIQTPNDNQANDRRSSVLIQQPLPMFRIAYATSPRH